MRYIVEFSGWIELGDDTKFQSLVDDTEISLIEYNALCKNRRRDFIIKDLFKAGEVAIDGAFEQIDLIEEED